MILLREKIFASGGKLDLSDHLVILGNKLKSKETREEKIKKLDKAMNDPETKKEIEAGRGHYVVPVPYGIIFGKKRVNASKDQLERERDRVKIANGDLTKKQFNKKWENREIEGDTASKRKNRRIAGDLMLAGGAATLAGTGAGFHAIKKGFKDDYSAFKKGFKKSMALTGLGTAAALAGGIKHYNNRRGEDGKDKNGVTYDWSI